MDNRYTVRLTNSFFLDTDNAVTLRANAVITDAVNVYYNEKEPADVGRIALP